MCELYIRDVKKKQMQNFNYLSGIQTRDTDRKIYRNRKRCISENV